MEFFCTTKKQNNNNSPKSLVLFSFQNFNKIIPSYLSTQKAQLECTENNTKKNSPPYQKPFIQQNLNQRKQAESKFLNTYLLYGNNYDQFKGGNRCSKSSTIYSWGKNIPNFQIYRFYGDAKITLLQQLVRQLRNLVIAEFQKIFPNTFSKQFYLSSG
eukprot:TRINITY_DN1242_c0_g2_i1.p3 TRINITY_DN1242_c0_g2~~TRINITY_DN1242_c0_g2_i1.p3  ORF type:complete len:158 (+),score=5.85 TRINITY_DN1242_c0_g2_i1:335-808(+)